MRGQTQRPVQSPNPSLLLSLGTLICPWTYPYFPSTVCAILGVSRPKGNFMGSPPALALKIFFFTLQRDCQYAWSVCRSR